MSWIQDTEFDLTTDHIKLLRRANIVWYECEAGAPGLDCKRPFGNSDVEADVCEILRWTPELDEDDGSWSDAQRERANEIFRGIGTALQIVLEYQTFEPGYFVRRNAINANWWRA